MPYKLDKPEYEDIPPYHRTRKYIAAVRKHWMFPIAMRYPAGSQERLRTIASIYNGIRNRELNGQPFIDNAEEVLKYGPGIDSHPSMTAGERNAGLK